MVIDSILVHHQNTEVMAVALLLTYKINKIMELKEILILTQVKGIGPAFFKKNRSRLMCCDDFWFADFRHRWCRQLWNHVGERFYDVAGVIS